MMDGVELVNALVGVFGAIGTWALHRRYTVLSMATRADLIAKMSNAIRSGDKLLASELYRMLYRRPLGFSVLVQLSQDDRAGLILAACDATPGVISYDESGPHFVGLARSMWVRRTLKTLSSLLNFILGSALIVFIGTMAFVPLPAAFALLLAILPLSWLLAAQVRDSRNMDAVGRLVGSE